MVDCANLRVYADHYQFWLEDDRGPREWDAAAVWDGAGLVRHLGVDRGAIAVGTGSYDYVLVSLDVLEAEPEDDSAIHDHVAEASLEVRAGRLLITSLGNEVAAFTA